MLYGYKCVHKYARSSLSPHSLPPNWSIFKTINKASKECFKIIMTSHFPPNTVHLFFYFTNENESYWVESSLSRRDEVSLVCRHQGVLCCFTRNVQGAGQIAQVGFLSVRSCFYCCLLNMTFIWGLWLFEI